MINILSRLEADIQAQFSDMKNEARPYTSSELDLEERGRSDALEGKKPQSNDPVYIDAYSSEKTWQMFRSAM